MSHLFNFELTKIQTNEILDLLEPNPSAKPVIFSSNEVFEAKVLKFKFKKETF